MSDIKGVSLIIGTGIKYLGSYKRGVWFDNCEIQDIPKEQRVGSGIKLDICFGHNIRPIGQVWKSDFWNNEKLRIIDIPTWQWEDFFGKELADKIRQLTPDRLYRGCYNSWYAKRWFVFRLPKWIPSMFISIGIGTLFSFYIGSKAYQIDPFPGDRDSTWTNEKDIDRAIINKEHGDSYPEKLTGSYFALCPSFTFRKTRQT